MAYHNCFTAVGLYTVLKDGIRAKSEKKGGKKSTLETDQFNSNERIDLNNSSSIGSCFSESFDKLSNRPIGKSFLDYFLAQCIKTLFFWRLPICLQESLI